MTTEYDKIQQKIQNLADDVFCSRNEKTVSTKNDVISVYTNVCSWLLCTVKCHTDDMTQDTYVHKYTNHNIFNEYAFSTSFPEGYSSGYLTEWQTLGFEFPFHLVQRIVKEKGYAMRVTEKKHREDLYASLTTTYTLEITKM